MEPVITYSATAAFVVLSLTACSESAAQTAPPKPASAHTVSTAAGSGQAASRANAANEQKPSLLSLIGTDQIGKLEFEGKPECGLDRKLLFAHYTAWHHPHYVGHSLSKYYNSPYFRPGKSEADSYRREVRVALASGLDGFFVDLVGRAKTGTVFVDQTERLLKAAEGTPFLVTGCLDGSHSDLEWAASELKKMIGRFSAYENFPRVNGRPLIVSYSSGGRTPEQWQQIKDMLKEEGIDIFLVLDMGHGFKKLTYEKTSGYAKAADMLYSFGESGISGQSHKECFDLIANGARSQAKPWMGTLHPGYVGAWFNGRNDYYQPHRGFDQIWDSFKSIDPTDATWLHLTTWNDHDETPLMPMVFDFGANCEINKAIINQYFRKTPAPESEARLYFAYHREEMPGTVLRIEALSLPRKHGGEVEVWGYLCSPEGKRLVELPRRNLSLADFDRAEWNMPTGPLSSNFALVPEILIQYESCRTGRTVTECRKLPAIMLKQGWIQNQTTMKVPFHAMGEADTSLSVSQNGTIVKAGLEVDSEDKILHASLWRNDRPVAVFSPDAESNPRLSFRLGMTKPHSLNIALKESSFTFVSRHVHTGDYQWTEDTFSGQNNIGWAWYTMQIECAPDAQLEVTVNKEEPVILTPVQLATENSVRLGKDKQCVFTMVGADCAIMNAPALDLGEVQLTASFYSRHQHADDIYYARLETASGKVVFSRMQAVSVQDVSLKRMKILQTMVNLETSSGATGMPGKTGYLGTPPFLQPEATEAALHPASLRAGFWDFENGGRDHMGNMHIGWSTVSKYIKPLGENGGNCLVLGKGDRARMRCRSYPIGACTIALKLYMDKAPSKEAKVVWRGGWSGALTVSITPRNSLVVTRDGGQRTPRQSVTVDPPLPLNKWVSVRATFDEQTVRVYVDRKLCAESECAVAREYGNCTPFLGDRNFEGRIDDVLFLSYAAPPEEK